MATARWATSCKRPLRQTRANELVEILPGTHPHAEDCRSPEDVRNAFSGTHGLTWYQMSHQQYPYDTTGGHAGDGRSYWGSFGGVPRPEARAGRDVDAVHVVGDSGDDGNLLRPLRSRHVGDDRRREEVVHLTRRAVELHLPPQLHVLDAVFGDERLVLLPRRPLIVTAVGQPRARGVRRFGFGVRGSGSGLEGSGIRGSGLGLEGSGSGSGFEGSGIRHQGPG